MNKRILSPANYEKESMIFDIGDDATYAYVVLEGMVEVRKRTNTSVRNKSKVGPGAFFGEEALAEQGFYQSSARALKDTKCIRISKGMLASKVAASDPFVGALFQIFSNHLASILKVKESASARAAVAKLAQQMDIEEETPSTLENAENTGKTETQDDDDDSFLI